MITITVTDAGMVWFEGDDPSEIFTVGLADDGRFSGNLPIDIDKCNGSLSISGQLDGSAVSGKVNGVGRC